MASKTPRHHKLWYQSSYDRGLENLLFIWPDIKREIPDAELHITYGWNLFDIANSNNAERMAWKEDMLRLLAQDGITEHGRLGKDKLKKLRKTCGIWAYPTYFTEINCISALESQKDGLVPCVINFKHPLNGKEVYTALNETVGTGVKVEGHPRSTETIEKYKKELLSLMKDQERWKKESLRAKEFSKSYTWNNISDKWIEEFEKPISTPKVSVITSTIREGFWNLMAQNLSEQSYKNFEWVIVDDHKDDRKAIADKYADKYSLDIKYIRGDKALGKYGKKHALSRSNNIGYKSSTGELTVWLQDFIVIPKEGIEALVDIYRKEPNVLIAPTDRYYFAKDANKDNKEDWWDGDVDIFLSKSWVNIRNTNEGLRYTENPLDFEMNWCAIPKHIIEKLNGWWEFLDEGIGFDNTEFAFRALHAGYKIKIDDTNVAMCLDLKHKDTKNRDRDLNTPRYYYVYDQTKKGNLPVTRDEAIDNNTSLVFSYPENLTDDEVSLWLNENAGNIALKWEKKE